MKWNYKQPFVSKKLWCEFDKNERYYYWCFIFKDKKTMHKFHEQQTGEKKTIFEAQCTQWKTIKGDKKCIGQVLFHQEACGVGIVSHEFTHATMYAFLYTKRIHPMKFYKKEPEEAFALLQGELVSQFWRFYWARFPDV